MRKTILAGIASAFLLMGTACTGTTISGAAVVAAVQQACGIIVPIADIAALVNANPTFNTVDLVANAICNAFKAQQAKAATATQPISGTLIINGVLIHYTVK